MIEHRPGIQSNIESRWAEAQTVMTAGQIITGPIPVLRRHRYGEDMSFYFGQQINEETRRQELYLFQNGQPFAPEYGRVDTLRVLNGEVDDYALDIALLAGIEDANGSILSQINERKGFLMFNRNTGNIEPVTLRYQAEDARVPAGVYADYGKGNSVQINRLQPGNNQPQTTLYASNTLYDAALAYARSLQPKIDLRDRRYSQYVVEKESQRVDPYDFIFTALGELDTFYKQRADQGNIAHIMDSQIGNRAFNISFLITPEEIGLYSKLESMFKDQNISPVIDGDRCEYQLRHLIQNSAQAADCKKRLVKFTINFCNYVSKQELANFSAFPVYANFLEYDGYAFDLILRSNGNLKSFWMYLEKPQT